MDGFLEFEPRMVMFKVNNRLIAEKFSRLTLEECGPCSVFPCYTLAFCLTNDGKGTEKPVRVVQMCQMGMIKCVGMAVFVFQRPRHITKGDGPSVCLRGDSGRRQTLGSGRKRPTWLLWGEEPNRYRPVHHPILRGPELPAAVSSLFAHDISYKRGQGCGPTAGPWAPSGGL
jgi:hypothetical protein